jgi:uncharacterized membrane protein
MKCPGCASEVEEGSSFCPFCGNQLLELDPLDDIKHLVRITREETTALLARLDLIQTRFESLELSDAGLKTEQEVPESKTQAHAHVPAQMTDNKDVPEELTIEELIIEEQVEEEFLVDEVAPADHIPAEQFQSQQLPGALAPEMLEYEEVVAAQDDIPAEPRPGFMSRLFGSEFGSATGSGFSEVRFGQKWLLIIGIIIMVLGIGYFLKYSFDRNWIGPAGRVAMAYTAGLACLAGGDIARRRLTRMFGLYLTGGGIAVFYFSTFAAFQIYPLFSYATAFGSMIVITALACALALYYDAMWLAVLGLIGGFLTPVILTVGADNQVALMTYLVILNLGILTIAFFKRWTLLNHLGLVGTWVLFSDWYFKYYDESKFWLTTFFLNTFFLIYAVVPFAYYFLKERTEKITGYAMSTPGTGIVLAYSYVTIEAYFSRQAVSLATVCYAAVFGAMAAYMYRKYRDNEAPFILLLSKAIVFLVISVPLLFSANWITVFWAIQAACVVWAALRLKNMWLYVGGLALLAGAAGRFLLWDYDKVFAFGNGMVFELGYTDILVERWCTTAFMLGAFFISAWMISRSDKSVDISGGHDGRIVYIGFTAILFIVLNIEVGAFFGDHMPDSQAAFITMLWTLFAMGLFLTAWRVRNKLSYLACLVLLALSAFKLLVVDYPRVFNLSGSIIFESGYGNLIFQRGLATIGLLGAVFIVAKLAGRMNDFDVKVMDNDPYVLFSSFTVLLFIVLNVEVGAFFGDYLPGSRSAFITMLWTAFAMGLYVTTWRTRNRLAYFTCLALLAAGTAKFVLLDYHRVFHFGGSFIFKSGYESYMVERWLASVGLLAAIFFVAKLARKLGGFNIKLGDNDTAIFYAWFTVLLFIVLNVEVSSYFGDYVPQARFASISVLWALFSICLMILGFAKRQAVVRRVSLILFAVTIVKVFLADMARASTPFRIISFIVLGVLLIGASYLYHKYKGFIIPEEDEVPEV